jgi:pectin-derived oligosaccharide transport system permease protein
MATLAHAPAQRRILAGRGRTIARTVFVLVLLAVVLYPIVWLLATSFKTTSEIPSNLSVIPREPTLGNYVRGWTGMETVSFARFFLNSTIIATGVVIANCASCLVTAYAFARLRFPLRGLWFGIMIATLLLPHHVLIVPQFVLFKFLGWIDTPLPLIAPKALATEAFFVFLMVQFMRGIPRELDEAAKMDGCSPFGIFGHVILPLARPAIVTTAIFSFIWTWNDFFSQLIYLNSVDNYTVPIGLRLFIGGEGQTELGPMFAMSMLSLVPVFLFFLAFQRLLVEGINTSGLKG